MLQVFLGPKVYIYNFFAQLQVFRVKMWDSVRLITSLLTVQLEYVDFFVLINEISNIEIA